MPFTRLELVQKILSSIDSENVESIGDTVESEQVADIVDIVHEEINTTYDWPHLKELNNLEVTSTAHQMKIPNDVVQINWIRYNGEDVSYVSPKRMLEILEGRDTSESNIDTNGAYNDRDPRYWTTWDEVYILFDAYDGSLQANKAKIEAIRLFNDMTLDTSTPDLPDRFEVVLLNGAKALAFFELKADDSMGQFFERRYKQGVATMKRWASRINKKRLTNMNINYGRRRYQQSYLIDTENVNDS